jgi:putative molybdopterin biosynthesis protein
VLKLRQVLASPDWASQLEAVSGYLPARGGEVLSLVRALPWWNFKSPKAALRDVVSSDEAGND